MRLIVTGATSGIGAALARRLAGPGLQVIVHGRSNPHGGEALLEEVRAAGGEAALVLGALEDPALPIKLVGEAVERFGGVDALVANAGWADRTPLLEVGEELAERALAAMPEAFRKLALAAATYLPDRTGRIVAVSAFGPHMARADVPRFPATSAAKAALEAHVRSLALELAGRGISVNAVAPGFIAKDRGTSSSISEEVRAQILAAIPMGRLGKPEEVAATIDFLLGEEAAYITGQILHVNGGLV